MNCSLFLRRISARIARQAVGEDREPVRELSDAECRHLDHLYAFAVALALCISMAALIVAITGRPEC